MTKVVVYAAQPAPEKIIRLRLVNADGKVKLVSTRPDGSTDWYIATIDEDGLHLHCLAGGSGLKTDSRGFVRSDKARVL